MARKMKWEEPTLLALSRLYTKGQQPQQECSPGSHPFNCISGANAGDVCTAGEIAAYSCDTGPEANFG